ncbi:8-amino-7-oxononanoate synthase [Oceaniferula spumae]|uniref:8-amino-7-oxononanoate synthase n=1 Tax=Oceaniferula spumae TaxID=2979115 RepID=A0AAT9FQY2_9BACT
MRQPDDELASLKQASLLRQLPAYDRSLINFSSNDYLGLSRHPTIISAYQQAVDQYGAGSTASRLVCGSLPPHEQLENLIAEAKGTEAALSFATGYATSVGVLAAVLQKGDTVILDKLCHASLIDGARLSGATIRVFPHNHLDKLCDLLESCSRSAAENSRTLVVTESIFSMDGDAAPLKEIAELTQKHRALLMVDEAHALGIRGQSGMGLAEELGISELIDFHMGTLGKAGGVAGGYLAASRSWIDLLVNKARSFIYSTAPPPAQAAAAFAGLQIIRSAEGSELRKKLWDNIQVFQEHTGLTAQPESAIIPWMVGDTDQALDLSFQLREKGFLVPAIRYPTVPRNTARLRVTISADHAPHDIRSLADCLR